MILGRFGTHGVPVRALGCNTPRRDAMKNSDLLRLNNEICCAQHRSQLQQIAPEATVNRLVAGSNPARGAKVCENQSFALG
jgi:aspartate carbamoyltransferase regulatory subunit